MKLIDQWGETPFPVMLAQLKTVVLIKGAKRLDRNGFFFLKPTRILLFKETRIEREVGGICVHLRKEYMTIYSLRQRCLTVPLTGSFIKLVTAKHQS